MPRKESTTGAISAQAQQDLVSDGIENYELPKSIVTKIAKSAVSSNNLYKRRDVALRELKSVYLDPRKCETAEGDGAFSCEGLNSVYKLSWYVSPTFCAIHNVIDNVITAAT